MKEKIIEGANQLFMRYGVRSVTMDDIASHLAISKKTIYQFFKNKDELVTTVSTAHMEMEKSEFEHIEETSDNAIIEIIEVSVCFRNHMKEFNPKLLFELKKYHPVAWAVYTRFKLEFVKGHIERNIVKGIAEGYYREEIDPEILALHRIEQVEMIFDDRIFPKDKHDFAAVQMQLFDHFIHGLLTNKGREIFNQYLISSQSKTTLI